MSWFGNYRAISTILFVLSIFVLQMSVPRNVQGEANYCGCRQIANELIIKFDENFSVTANPLPPQFRTAIPLLDSLFSSAKLKLAVKLPFSLVNADKNGDSSAAAFRFIFADSLDFSYLLPKLNQLKLIDFAEPNYCYWGAGHLHQAWELLAEASLEKLDLAEARQFTRNTNDIIIGLVDAGFENSPRPFSEVDAENFPRWINREEIIYLNDPASPATKPTFSSQHGYLLGGLIQQIVSEMKPHARSPLKMLPISAGTPFSETCLQFTATRCAAAIDYAVDHQAKIILLGWSGPNPSRLLQNSINRAYAHGTFIVAAAGNQNQNVPVFPAAWPHVLSVAATDLNDLKSGSSNFGKWIDVSAPGNFAKKETPIQLGTSAAAAIVTGLAALIQAADVEVSPDSLMRRIIYSCDNIDSLNPKYRGLLGAGRVNALRAIKGDFQPNIALRAHKIEFVRENAVSENYFNYRLHLTLENIAADASEVSVQLAGLPPEILVKPEVVEISDFRFHQTRHCEFWVKFPAGQVNVDAQLRVTAENTFYKTIPLKIQIPLFASSDFADSVSVTIPNQSGPAASLSRQYDFRPQTSFWVPAGQNSRLELLVLGSVPAGGVKGVIWNETPDLNSFILNIDSLSRKTVFLEDLNADGLPDLCVGSEGAWQIFLNHGSNNFATNPVETLPATSPLVGAFFDLNLDGLPDFLTNNPALTIYQNQGDCNFSRRASGISIGLDQLKIFDLNSDGHPDLIGLPNSADNLRIYWGSDTWFFADNFTELEIRADQFQIYPLDSDFSNDLIVVKSKPDASQLKIYRNRSGQFFEQQSLTLPLIHQVLAGDFDRDQDFDLLLLFKNQAPQILLNDGQANFSAAPFRFTQKTLAFGTLLDFNRNGALDLAGITQQGDSVQIFFNNFPGIRETEPPAVPKNLTQKIDSTQICLSWEAATTEEAGGATFELRIWSGTDASEKIFPDKFGPGNLGQSNHFKFKPEFGKNYFWTIQAVDASFRRSEWAPVQQVHSPNRPPKILTFWPRQDTTLTRGDSLCFRVMARDADGDSLKFNWQTNSAQTGADSIFNYIVSTWRQFRDSVWVTVADSDTTIQHAWEIKIRRVNLPPEVVAHFPDSLLLTVKEGDSLEFRIRARDLNGDTLSFDWLNVQHKMHSENDSVLRVKWDYFSAGFDSVGVRVADPDTAIEFWWHIKVQNTNQLPQITRCFPQADTALYDPDSLKISLEIFEPDSQPFTIFWRKNSKPMGEFDNQPFFRLFAPDIFPKKDTIVAHISDGDTTLQKQWIITSRKKNQCPQIVRFWPLQDTTIVEGDSLEFRVQSIDEDADSLKYFWRVNQQTAVSFDSLFQYHAIFLPPGIDTVEVEISDGDTLVNHIWLVEIINVNTAPTVPQPLFPLQGEILLESECLQWCSAYDPDPEDKRLTYFVQIAHDTNFANICSVDSVKADTVFSLRGCSGFHQFESGETYYWRVQAVDYSRDTSRVFPDCGCFRFQHVSARILKAYGKNNGEGGITVFWETVQEKGNLGFHILRKTSLDGEFQRINEMLIRGTSPYSYLDSDVAAGETYYYSIECVSVTGVTFRQDVIEVSAPIPEAFALHQNYPNPLTLETLIRFQIPRKCHVTLSVYNILGEEVRKLVKEIREKGFYDVIWNGRDENGREVGSGIYFYSITAENFHETRKIMVVR